MTTDGTNTPDGGTTLAAGFENDFIDRLEGVLLSTLEIATSCPLFYLIIGPSEVHATSRANLGRPLFLVF